MPPGWRDDRRLLGRRQRHRAGGSEDPVGRQADLRVVGVAEDYDGLVAGVLATQPHVLVTDIRMPPTFQREGIEAAREVASGVRAPGW